MAKPNKAQNSAKAAAKKRVVKVDASGEVRISATFNNLIIAFTNKAGQVISWSSAGKMGFRGSKKNTPYAAQMAAACEQCQSPKLQHTACPTCGTYNRRQVLEV